MERSLLNNDQRSFSDLRDTSRLRTRRKEPRQHSKIDDNSNNAKLQASWTRMTIIKPGKGERGRQRISTNFQTQIGECCTTEIIRLVLVSTPGPGGLYHLCTSHLAVFGESRLSFVPLL